MDFDKVIAALAGHWPFLAVAFILGVVGEVIKGIVLGKDNEKVKTSKFARLFKQTLPLHPIVAGGLLGLLLSTTIPDVVMTGGMVSSSLYFAVSGALSSSIYALLESLKPQIAKAIKNKVASLAGTKQEPVDRTEEAEKDGV